MIEGGGADFNLIDITSLCLTPLLASIYIYIYIAHTWGQELVMERAKHNGIIAHNLRLFEPEVLENEFLIPRDGLSIYLSIYLSLLQKMYSMTFIFLTLVKNVKELYSS